MIEMKTFWCEDVPQLDDIKHAYELVEQGYAVTIEWYVKWSGSYSRMVTKSSLEKYPTPEEYFEIVIPHIYGV